MKLKIDDFLLDKEALQNTPQRWRAFQAEQMEKRNYDKFTTFKNNGYDGMVIQRVEFHSSCMHHILPFYGVAYIGYIANKKSLIGLSKLARIVDKFASKPTTQETINLEIVKFINKILHPQGVMVVIKARHMCMEMRGVHKSNSWTVTSQISGLFQTQSHTKSEFFELIKLKFLEV